MSDLTLINWTAICSCALRAPPRQRRPIGWQTTHRCNPERVHSSYALDWVFYQTSATRSPLLNTNSISGFVYHRVQSQPWLSLTLFGFLCRLLLLRYRKGCQVLWWVRLCVCVCVCVCVLLSVCTRGYLWNCMHDLYQITCAYCLWLWLGPSPASLRYDTLCTSGFVDDIMLFSIIGHIAVWISLRTTDLA